MGKIKQWIFLQKEGILVGSIIGAGFYYLNWNLPINLHAEGIAKLIIMILIFGGIGMGLDALIEPSK